MGQAFDKDGAMMGEVEAATKREVFEKLNAMHPTAAEIRIRTLREQTTGGGDSQKDQTTAPVDRMLQFFACDHLPPHLAAVSGSFCQLAYEVVATLPSNPERTAALRKLLEAKDCAVRALLFK